MLSLSESTISGNSTNSSGGCLDVAGSGTFALLNFRLKAAGGAFG
jgi:hypothetical protein